MLKFETLEQKTMLSTIFTFDGEWVDAEKSLNNPDDNQLCWAASAANLLSWGNWSKMDAQSTFEHLIDNSNNFTGLPSYAIRWWFDGFGVGAMNPGEGYYQGVNWRDYYREISGDNILNDVGSMLEDGYAASLHIKNATLNHIITLWGVEYEEDIPVGVYISDSDDYQTLLDYRTVEYVGNQWMIEDAYIYRAYAFQSRDLHSELDNGIILSENLSVAIASVWVDINNNHVQDINEPIHTIFPIFISCVDCSLHFETKSGWYADPTNTNRYENLMDRVFADVNFYSLDKNSDGFINSFELDWLMSRWGMLEGDLNGDGLCNSSDLNILRWYHI